MHISFRPIDRRPVPGARRFSGCWARSRPNSGRGWHGSLSAGRARRALSWGEQTGTCGGGLLFWGALALCVVGLLSDVWSIARLFFTSSAQLTQRPPPPPTLGPPACTTGTPCAKPPPGWAARPRRSCSGTPRRGTRRCRVGGFIGQSINGPDPDSTGPPTLFDGVFPSRQAPRR